MGAQTISPVSTRRSYQAAYNKSPLTDIADIVGANASSLTVVAKSFKTHRDLTSLLFHPSCPTCEQDGFARRYVRLLDQREQLQILHLRDFSLVSSHDFVGW